MEFSEGKGVFIGIVHEIFFSTLVETCFHGNLHVTLLKSSFSQDNKDHIRVADC